MMEKFLKKLAFWIIPFLSLHVMLGLFADGNTDDNYRHFTSQASSIVLGDSRGSQAIVSSVLNSYFNNKKFDNFSLNISQSPYGPLYFAALKKKIKPNTKDGIFILTVSPWNLSTRKDINNERNLPENKISPFRNMHFYNLNPNYEYLLKNLNSSWFNIFRDRESVAKSNTYLHEDGWLEVTIDMSKQEAAKRTEEKVEFYNLFKDEQKLSDIRLQSFEEIINFLKSKGQVYVVRIPTSEGLINIENQYCPNFNQIIEEITKREKIHYFDFSPNFADYHYTDGNHMYKESSKKLTAQIADSIRNTENLR